LGSFGADGRHLGPPERILVYHGGTGRTIFLGMLRITTIFVFGASCLVVAPAFGASEFPVYIAPAGEFFNVPTCSGRSAHILTRNECSHHRRCSPLTFYIVYCSAVCELYPSGSSSIYTTVSRTSSTLCSQSTP
jgi:hypothetical protein